MKHKDETTPAIVSTGNPEAHINWGEGAEEVDPWSLSDAEFNKIFAAMQDLPEDHPQRKVFQECKDLKLVAQVGCP